MLYNILKQKGDTVMPPKPKFSREDIINAAFDIVQKSGTDAMTAREVGKYLGTSSTPIFTAFNDMSELRAAVCDKARKVFDEYMAVAEDFSPAYKKRGMQWVKFARENPMLFQLLFMSGSETETDFNSAVEIMPFGKENDIAIITRDYNATPEQADEACGIIRGVLAALYGKDVAEAVTIQYGGSMNDGNAAELLGKYNVDGGLIGGASLVPEKFDKIVTAAQ